VRVARVPIVGMLASAVILVHAAAASAWTRTDDGPPASGQSASLYRESRAGMVGLGFGFGPWWGPYDAYAPPAVAFPPPLYSVPPPRVTTRSPLGCQQFESTVIVDGQPRIARGLACPQPDGSWRIVR
jgi:hypothetical protein